MYGVVMCDHMRDYLGKEFMFAYGNTKKEAVGNAWNDLKAYIGKDIKELEFDYVSDRVTKKLFMKYVIDNGEKSDDGLYISSPFDLYIKLFEIPSEIEK